MANSTQLMHLKVPQVSFRLFLAETEWLTSVRNKRKTFMRFFSSGCCDSNAFIVWSIIDCRVDDGRKYQKRLGSSRVAFLSCKIIRQNELPENRVFVFLKSINNPEALTVTVAGGSSRFFNQSLRILKNGRLRSARTKDSEISYVPAVLVSLQY